MSKFETYLEAVREVINERYVELNPTKNMDDDKKDMSPKSLEWRLEAAHGVRKRESNLVHLFLRPYREGESKSSAIPSDVKNAVAKFIAYIKSLPKHGSTVDLSAETPKAIAKTKGYYIQLTESP